MRLQQLFVFAIAAMLMTGCASLADRMPERVNFAFPCAGDSGTKLFVIQQFPGVAGVGYAAPIGRCIGNLKIIEDQPQPKDTPL